MLHCDRTVTDALEVLLLHVAPVGRRSDRSTLNRLVPAIWWASGRDRPYEDALVAGCNRL